MPSLTILFLFGGDKSWNSSDWTDSDDRVRGGSSKSELLCHSIGSIAIFQGLLDTKTLGGAGFASQRTTGEERSWDLSSYDGMLLDITKGDEKKYTLILKDQLLPKSPNGREQSTVSWEYDFKPKPDGEKVYVSWDEFKPTYRGREKKDVEPLNLKSVKRISIMMRSFFATQEGDFSLSIKSIASFKKYDAEHLVPYQDDPSKSECAQCPNVQSNEAHTNPNQQGWVGRIFGFCVGL